MLDEVDAEHRGDVGESEPAKVAKRFPSERHRVETPASSCGEPTEPSSLLPAQRARRPLNPPGFPNGFRSAMTGLESRTGNIAFPPRGGGQGRPPLPPGLSQRHFAPAPP